MRNGAAGQPVHSGTPLRLVNVTIAKVLAYGWQDNGINLVWQDAAGQQNVRFYKVGGGPIRYGDRLALHVEGGGFVRYGQRDYGINLVWSGSAGAVYEWELVGGTAGTQVVSGSNRSHVLRNTTVPAPSARRRPWSTAPATRASTSSGSAGRAARPGAAPERARLTDRATGAPRTAGPPPPAEQRQRQRQQPRRSERWPGQAT